MRTISFPAFHGTSQSVAEKIVTSKEFLPSAGRGDHWLGIGSYFFREDFDQALMWARYKYKKHYEEGKKLSVVEVEVEASERYILNLDRRAGMNFLDNYVKSLVKERRINIKGSDQALNKATIACFVFSSLNPEEIWTIVRTFPVPSAFDRSSDLQRLSFKHQQDVIRFGLQGTQVCVKNNKAIAESSIRSHGEKDSGGKITVIPTKKETVSDDLFSK